MLNFRQTLLESDLKHQSNNKQLKSETLRITLANKRNTNMIKTFKHKGRKDFFESGSNPGIRPDHASKLSRQLVRLDIAKVPADMNLPGWRLHPLEGELAGHYSVTVNGNWRMTFMFDGEDAILVDYQDYH